MNWKDALISGAIYIIGIGGIGLILFGMSGCSVYQELPGLCYTDKTETKLCPKEELIYIDSIPNYNRSHTCITYYSLDEEQWLWCMDPQNDYLYDPYYQERQEIYKELYKEKLMERMTGLAAIA